MSEVDIEQRVPGKRLNSGIALRILLILFVGVNLTLVCQGHDEGGHHTGSHLVFAEEPEAMADSAMAAPAPVSIAPGASDHIAHVNQEQSSDASTAAPKTGCQIQSSASGPGEEGALSSLGLALLFLIVRPGAWLQRLGTGRLRSLLDQTSLRPDYPPPR